MKIAITGTPGVGKTTLAAALAAEFALEVLTAGDVARLYDPTSILRGAMADPEVIRRGVMEFTRERSHWILDGFPRTVDQHEMLPPDTILILMRCREDIAVDRLLRRGRSDDTEELIRKKIAEQSALLDGWAYDAATWRQTLETSMKRPSQIAADVTAFLMGAKREVV